MHAEDPPGRDDGFLSEGAVRPPITLTVGTWSRSVASIANPSRSDPRADPPEARIEGVEMIAERLKERVAMSDEADRPASELLGSCPLPKSRYDHILLGHGSGGQMTADLIGGLFVPGFGGDVLGAMEDAATLRLDSGNGVKGPRLAFTTDSFVVRPLFFPGGDIGTLAIHGTVNDLAVSGARPLFLSAAFILEEGLPIDDLRRIVASMRAACEEAGVTLVTGDTKVVDRGKGDGVFITTAGVGLVPEGLKLSIHSARPGDRIVLSGTLGDHGIAIMSVREGLDFETALESDSAALNGLAGAVLDACPATRCMRDPTRGGLSSALNELADASGVGVPIGGRGDPAQALGEGGMRDARSRPALRCQRGGS